MRPNTIKLISWLAGISGVIAIILYVRPADLGETISAAGWQGLVSWSLLTLVARIALAETTVAPLRVLGFHLSRMDAFSIGWVRTFANQIVPISGVAAYAHFVRSRVQISWSELAALAAPQFVLGAAAMGIVGLMAIAANLGRLQSIAYILAAAYLLVVIMAIALASGAAWLLEALPSALSSRAARTANALRRLATHPNLIAKIIAYHGLAIMLRGARMWVLFSAAGVILDWRELMLLLAIAESSMLFNVTPGGLGIREALVLSGSALIGIPPAVAVSVAVIDRLFVISTTALLVGPAIVFLRGAR